jgi:hypothetical protein
MANEVKIIAFRATEDRASCERFLLGHRRVLEHHGVRSVKSSKEDWLENPSVFVILVESPDESRIYGGARLHCVDGIHPLPLEEAITEMDPNIHFEVTRRAHAGTGELCGLWNSREVAGMGIGAFFATMCGVVVAEQIGISSIFALCSPYSVRFAQRVGCQILTNIGKNGTFYYPKIDLLATLVVLEDCKTLCNADPGARERIFELRENPRQQIREKSPLRGMEFEINYNLLLQNVFTDEFKMPATTDSPIH